MESDLIGEGKKKKVARKIMSRKHEAYHVYVFLFCFCYTVIQRWQTWLAGNQLSLSVPQAKVTPLDTGS